MRICEYRAIPIGEKNFIYGTIIKIKGVKKDRYYILPQPVLIEVDNKTLLYAIAGAVEVKRNTIGRYTGYRESAFERDRKIYEGDIVEGKLFDEKFVGIVEIDEFNTAVFYPILHVSPEGKIKMIPKKDRFEEPLDMMCCVSIIGNIHTKKILTPKKYKEFAKDKEGKDDSKRI